MSTSMEMTCMRAFVCVCVCVCGCVGVCGCVWVWVCVGVCVWVCGWVYGLCTLHVFFRGIYKLTSISKRVGTN